MVSKVMLNWLKQVFQSQMHSQTFPMTTQTHLIWYPVGEMTIAIQDYCLDCFNLSNLSHKKNSCFGKLQDFTLSKTQDLVFLSNISSLAFSTDSLMIQNDYSYGMHHQLNTHFHYQSHYCLQIMNQKAQVFPHSQLYRKFSFLFSIYSYYLFSSKVSTHSLILCTANHGKKQVVCLFYYFYILQ